MNKLNLDDHPYLVHSLSILHMENGDCFANIFCVDGDKYFVDDMTYMDKHSAEVGGKAEALHDKHIVYIDTIEMVQIRD